VAGRFEDYVQGRERLGARELDAVQAFVDRVGEIIRRGIDEHADPATGATLLRGLPARTDVEALAAAVTKDVAVLLVTSSRVVGRLVEREMSSLGYRVTGAPSPFVAFELAVRLKPALMLVSATLDGLDGVDLARALGAMTATRDVPVLVLTSFAAGDARLRDLPASARIVQTGSAFTEQLADALVAFKLL
jgi:CheY-like chemotaxis protein